MFDPTIANVLPNGAEILQRHRHRDGVWVWLAFWAGNAAPYVTWLSNVDNPGETYWGHYWETSDGALEDFNKRKQ